MDRLTAYLSRYDLLSEDTILYLDQKGKLCTFDKGDYFVAQDEVKQNWCFLLEGLVGYQIINDKGKTILERLCPVNHYFVGTKHIYSKSTNRTAIQFIQPSAVYIISNEDLKNGIRKYKDLNEIYHILQQHELELTKIFLRIPNLDRIERLSYLYNQLPSVKEKLNVRQLISLLGYTNSRQYYEALNYYYTNNNKK